MKRRKIPIYFDRSITLVEIMRAAHSIGATLCIANGELLVTKTDPTRPATSTKEGAKQ